MKIDRSNYEIWIIDWLDGNLSDLQVEQLQFFLSENPELKEEFSELNTLIIKPSMKSFSRKELLRKSIDELSVSQFEYLCIAYLEKDLSPSQQTELKEIISNDPQKQRTFELIQKMRLVPGNVSYKNKKKLVRITPFQNILRLSAIGLSAAATITLFFIAYITTPRTLPVKTDNTARYALVDSTLLKPSIPVVSEKNVYGQITLIDKQINETQIAVVRNNSSVITQPDSTIRIPNASLVRNTSYPENPITKIPVYAEIDLKVRGSNKLVVSAFSLPITEYDDDRSRLSKFLARTFREKILKESKSEDSPLKAYEIAEAGVTGINKLLGWEMALDQRNDENGELRSVFFSSRLLKFNAPVKKNDPLP